MQTLCLMLTSFKSVCMIVATRLGVEYIEQIKELFTFIYIYIQWNLSIMVAFRPQFLGLIGRWLL